MALTLLSHVCSRIDPDIHKALTVFVDPIDGTREFATAQGDYVSMLIGFNDAKGKPVAGMMYRPLTQPVSWAAGAASEECVMGTYISVYIYIYIYIYVYIYIYI